mmetsp:Transcript_19100/g.41620  ORF Transcript_19100/g.41620 Transcript_19100/m.41620 type:complete len:266 (+) Transcript_19100:173-970(+)
MSSEDVILHVYELHAGNGAQQQQQQSNAAASSSDGDGGSTSQQQTPAAALLPILRRVGLGTYHTSLEVRSRCYSYAAGHGIVQSDPPSAAIIGGGSGTDSHAPTNAQYSQRIVLGSTDLDRGKINELIRRMRDTSFTTTGYHLLNRNCNHFTTTLAMAVLHYDGLADAGYTPKLDTYPSWINRLARTGTGLGCLNDTDICDPIREARVAAGAESRVGWGLSSKPGNASKSAADGGNGSKVAASSSKKKELTEEQKKMLAKLKKKG